MKTIKEHTLAASFTTPHFYEMFPAKAMDHFCINYHSLIRLYLGSGNKK
jgi:hypothetical protein